MYCDYKALAEYAVRLNKNFNIVSKSITNIENSVLLISNNLHTETRDYFLEQFRKMQDNFDIISNQFNNINQYVDQVITNYKSAEKDMFDAFGG